MLEKSQVKWFYAIVLVFIGTSIISFASEFYAGLLIAPAMLIAWLWLVAPYRLFLFTVFFIPLSIPMHHFSENFGLIIPTEPLAVILAFTFIIHLLVTRNYDKKILKNTITILILAHLLWMFVTTLSSTMPFVSFKYFLQRVTYIVVFYFLTIPFFSSQKNIFSYFRIFIIALSITVFIVTYRHYLIGFERDKFIEVVNPFYYNHGIYTATLAFFIPAIFIFTFYGRTFKMSMPQMSLLGLLGLVFIFSEVFSFTRAAWVSLIGAVVVWILLRLKIPIKILFGTLVLSLVLLVTFHTELRIKMRQNEQGSTRKSNLEEHFQSISNIKNDPSNLERINRWNSAIRMFEERPLLGFGPGTFTFQYAPYQRYRDLTIISTNFGSVGHAHSEYLGPLAEGGAIAALLWLSLFIVIIYKGIKLVYHHPHKEGRLIALACVLGLTTYFIHGVLNSYIDYDKIASSLWAFSAIIVALELYQKKDVEEVSE